MPDNKRIALFLDGTWNNVSNNTNVWRLKSLCVQSPEQLVYYSAGVGTQQGEQLSGGMFGIGIDDEVTSAYEWLVENYEEGAELFIFGFSRGAFTARSLAGFISKCGLLKPGSPVSLKQMFERYRKGTAISILELAKATESALSVEDKLIKNYSQSIAIWFQGVWDTVGSLGVPLPFFPKVNSKDFTFLETDLRINDTHAYHALAIDEHREAFAPTLWVKSTPTGKLPPLGRPLRPPTPHLRCLLPHCLLHDRPQKVMKQPLGRLLACKVVRGSGTHHKHQPNRYFRTGPLPATKLEATLQSPSAIDCVSLNAIS